MLLDLARTPVKAIEKLERVRGLPRPVEQAHGAQILAATAKGLAVPANELPEQKDFEPTPQQRFRADALFATMQCLASGKSIDPALVTSRQELGELYRCLSTNQSLEKIPLMTGWRKNAVGKELLDLVDGKATMQVNWTESMTAKIIASPKQ